MQLTVNQLDELASALNEAGESWAFAEDDARVRIAQRWREFIRGTYEIVFDGPTELPSGAARIAAYSFLAIARNPLLTAIAKTYLNRVVVHSGVARPDAAVAVQGNSIHFFESKIETHPEHIERMTSQELGELLFGYLTEARQHWRSDATMRGRFLEWFQVRASGLSNLHVGVQDDDQMRDEIKSLVDDWLQQELVGPAEPRTNCANGLVWSEEKNKRRCDLIDKQFDGAITAAERQELDQLQDEAMAYRDRVAPLPIEGALKLHKELLQKRRTASQE